MRHVRILFISYNIFNIFIIPVPLIKYMNSIKMLLSTKKFKRGSSRITNKYFIMYLSSTTARSIMRNSANFVFSYINY